ncbi:uncharacterized protein LOC126786491 [Argentina anserina]|uniref:uncharacterized protein LOC126786491 n=1 Tax=Argentina anserina TaxID=57926 RepID=UPI0021765B8D|nr:uncharacterized protein LOC126786491 [Potentilla anserina]
MPSPSLSYFNQTKASCLPGTHKSSSQPHKIPNVRQIGSVNPIYNLRLPLLEKIPNETNAGTVIENIDVQCSSSVPSVITAATDKVDSVSQLRHVQKELKLRSNSKGNGMTGDHKKINSMEDVIFRSDDKYLMDQESSLAFPEKSIEIQGHILERVADANSEVHNSSAAEYKILDALSYSRCKDQTKDESSALKRISRISHLDDAEMLDSDRKLCEVNDVNDCRSNEVEMVDSPNVENIALVSGDNGPDEECHRYNTGNNEDICLEVKLSVASGLQSNPDLLKYVNLEEEANQEVDDRIDVIKEPLPGSLKDLSTVANCTHSNTHELSGFLDLRHPNAIAVQVSQEHKPKSDLNGALHPNNTSCKEYEDMDELVLDWLDGCESDPKLSNACIVVTSAIYDGRPDLGAEVDYSNLELAVTRSSMVEQSPEDVHDHTISRDSNVLCDQAASVESDLSLKTTNEEDSVRTLACNSLEGKSPSLFDQTSPSGSILQDNGVIVLGSKTLAEDAETSILRSNHTVNDEMQHELDDSVNSPRDNEAAKELKKSMSGKKQEGLVIIPPSNAVPFSDEWLAAIEAAGEEILTKKGGAVQNSPPNKSPPQLGPYSPVKRKQKQVIGPFDCTKHINPP